MKRWFALALSLSVFFQGISPVQAERLTLPKDSAVIVKLAETVSSGTHKKGDKISLFVVTDVIQNGKTVIKANTPVTGTVESAAKRFLAGIGGQLEISVDQVAAVDGTIVPLKFTKETHNGSSLMSIILTYCCCILFVFIPGKNVSIEKDTIFNAVTLSPMEINVP